MVAYEILLMLESELAEERQEEIIVRLRELVERGGGSWVGHDPWGQRKLAYEIDHKSEGIYHLLNFDAEPETLAEISRILRITDGVMRHLAVHRIESRPGSGREHPRTDHPRTGERERSVGAARYAPNTRSDEEEE